MKRILIFIMVICITGLLTSSSALSAGLNGDFNGDGDVDGDDLVIFSENFGKTNNSCSDNDYCSLDYYCQKAAGDCDGIGQCQLRPTVCPVFWDPVCGCDGTTYSNACFAAMAGVNVDYSGECSTITYCYGNDMCAPDEYCHFNSCDAETGICLPRPDICPELWDPVCGCDGQTYGNACEAARAGISLLHEGECKKLSPIILE